MTVYDIAARGVEILGTLGIFDECVSAFTDGCDVASHIKPNIIKHDFLRLLSLYDKHNDKKVANEEMFAWAMVTDVLDYHGIKYDVDDMIDVGDEGNSVFFTYCERIGEFSRHRYWQNSEAYWTSG